jgi:hypothetical protein
VDARLSHLRIDYRVVIVVLPATAFLRTGHYHDMGRLESRATVCRGQEPHKVESHGRDLEIKEGEQDFMHGYLTANARRTVRGLAATAPTPRRAYV